MNYECIECHGSGRTTLMPDGHEVECDYCEGTGIEVSSEELVSLVKLEQLVRHEIVSREAAADCSGLNLLDRKYAGLTAIKLKSILREAGLE